MKRDQIKINLADTAIVIAEVAVSLETRTIAVRLCQIESTGRYAVLRNDFMQGSFEEKEPAVKLFMEIIEDEAI